MAGIIVSTAARLFWRRLGIMVLANLLWLLMSLPIITWPAATAGLFTVVRRVVAEETDDASQEARIGDFWDGFRAHWKRSTLVILLDLAGTGIIAFALIIYGGAGEPLRWLVGPIALIGLGWLAGQLYVFPVLLERRELSPWRVIRQALVIVLVYPVVSLSLLLTSLVLAVAAAVLAGPVLFVFFSAMAMVQTVAMRHVLSHRGETHEATP